VVGRKNHYGSKLRRGTEVAATLYSLLETAKLTGSTRRSTSLGCPRRWSPRSAAPLAPDRGAL